MGRVVFCERMPPTPARPPAQAPGGVTLPGGHHACEGARVAVLANTSPSGSVSTNRRISSRTRR